MQNNAATTDTTVCASVISAGGVPIRISRGSENDMNAPNANITMLLLRDIRIKLRLINVGSVGDIEAYARISSATPKGTQSAQVLILPLA